MTEKKKTRLYEKNAEDDEAGYVQDVLRQVPVGRVVFVPMLLPSPFPRLGQPRAVPRAVEGGGDGGVQQTVAVAVAVVVEGVDVAGVGVMGQVVAVAGQVSAAVGGYLVVVVFWDCNDQVNSCGV